MNCTHQAVSMVLYTSGVANDGAGNYSVLWCESCGALGRQRYAQQRAGHEPPIDWSAPSCHAAPHAQKRRRGSACR